MVKLKSLLHVWFWYVSKLRRVKVFDTGQQTEGRKVLKRVLVKAGKNEENFIGNGRKDDSMQFTWKGHEKLSRMNILYLCRAMVTSV